jgi:hypothetical protein
MNDQDRTYIERHSTKGAAVGRKRKAANITLDVDKERETNSVTNNKKVA